MSLPQERQFPKKSLTGSQKNWKNMIPGSTPAIAPGRKPTNICPGKWKSGICTAEKAWKYDKQENFERLKRLVLRIAVKSAWDMVRLFMIIGSSKRVSHVVSQIYGYRWKI